MNDTDNSKDMGVFGIIALVLSAIATIGSGISNFVAQRKTNQTNKEMYEDWKEYNTPANQMSRLTDAGLNPYMVNGVSNTLSQPFQVGQTPNLGDMFTGLQNVASQAANLGVKADIARKQRELTEKIQTAKLEQQWEALKLRERMVRINEKLGDAKGALLWSQGTIAQINAEILKRSKSFIIGSKFYDYLRSQQEYSFNELMNPQILSFYAPFKKSEISRNLASAEASRANASHLSFLDRYLTNRLLFDKIKFGYEFPFKVNSFWANYNQKQQQFWDRLRLSGQYESLAEKKFLWDVILRGIGVFQKDRNDAFMFLNSVLPY